mmetsp:Transcript_138530/g.351103  ORF Transcript_138530/g.351103 Transcript_138530/m.351103 type:complete len:292 (-) Transcript_138530:82-957(-)
MVHQRLTLINATDRIECRGGIEAIRRQSKVIRDDDARRGGVGVVQDTGLLEKLRVLLEIPKVMLLDARIEVAELDAACAADLLQLEQLLLDVFAVDSILMLSVSLADGLDDSGHVREGKRGQTGSDLLLHVSEELPCLLPERQDAVHARVHLIDHLAGELRHVATEHISLHEGVDNPFRAYLVKHALGALPVHLIGSLQTLDGLGMDHVLERRRQDGKLMEVQAVAAEALVQEVLDMPRDSLAQGSDRRRRRPSFALWSHPLDLPPVALHEEPVDSVTGPSCADGATLVLR